MAQAICTCIGRRDMRCDCPCEGCVNNRGCTRSGVSPHTEDAYRCKWCV